MKTPSVSWLIPTTLHRHRWWRRLVEFLEEDFPVEHIECIFVGTQDKNFRYEAQHLAEQVCESLAFIPGVAERWRKVRFIEQYSSEFNISTSRNILLDAAQGDIVIYRDADTALLRHGFTNFAAAELLRSRYGMLSFPSLRNGEHFKPKRSLVTLPDPSRDGLSLACSVNGMATVALRSVLNELGGWNNMLGAWGEHTAMCTKIARAGLLMGYTNNGYWLGTATGESAISLTDDTVNPRSLRERQRGVALLRAFYDIMPHDTFWSIASQDYGIDWMHLKNMDASRIPGYARFALSQRLCSTIEKYDFKPWECLSHPETEAYIHRAADVARPYFESVKQGRLLCV